MSEQRQCPVWCWERTPQGCGMDWGGFRDFCDHEGSLWRRDICRNLADGRMGRGKTVLAVGTKRKQKPAGAQHVGAKRGRRAVAGNKHTWTLVKNRFPGPSLGILIPDVWSRGSGMSIFKQAPKVHVMNRGLWRTPHKNAVPSLNKAIPGLWGESAEVRKQTQAGRKDQSSGLLP